MSAKKNNKEGQWSQVSSQWKLIGPPLKPVQEDVAFIRETAMEWTRTSGCSPRALIMGVTPEYHNLPWPKGTTLYATDNNKAMIEHVWPGEMEAVKLDSWITMDWPDDHFDIAVCDGGLHLLDHPHSQNLLVERLASILSAGGLFILRLFTPPAQPESPESVIEDLLKGSIANMNCLKIRLGTAMQDNPEAGICLDKIWKFLHGKVGDWLSLAEKLNWPKEEFAVVDCYKGNQAHYYFCPQLE